MTQNASITLIFRAIKNDSILDRLALHRWHLVHTRISAYVGTYCLNFVCFLVRSDHCRPGSGETSLCMNVQALKQQQVMHYRDLRFLGIRVTALPRTNPIETTYHC
jgi:hypothetical protein